jgi:hypothetical protein
LSSGGVTCLNCGYPLVAEREDARRLLCTECGAGHNLELEGADGKPGVRWLARRVLSGIWSCRDVRRVLAGNEQDFKRGGTWSLSRLVGLLIASYLLAGLIPTLSIGIRHFRWLGVESLNISIFDVTWILGAAVSAVDWAVIGLVAAVWWLAMTIVIRLRGRGIRVIASVSLASLVLVPWVLALPVSVSLLIASFTMSIWSDPWEGLMRLCLRFAVLITTTAWISWWWFGAIRKHADVRRVLYAIAIGLTVAWTMHSLYPYES